MVVVASDSPGLRRRRQFAPVVVFGLIGLGLIVTQSLEQKNRPYTLNFVTAEDAAFATATFGLAVLGLYLLTLRPGHLTGRLLLASIGIFVVASLAHALAVRFLLATDGPGWIGSVAAWFATFLYAVAIGVAVLIPSTWPAGRVEQRWLRILAYGAIAAIIALALAQALAPDTLDGVASPARIDNPLGFEALRGPTAVLSSGVVLYLVAFLVLSTVDLGLRTARSGRRGLTWVASIVAIVGFTVVGFVAHSVIGDGAWFAGVLALSLAGVGVLILVAVRAERRRRAVETARTEIVAQREAERRGLRADLHDGLGPLLAALGLVLDDAGEAPPLTQARTLLAEAMAEVRRISRDLGPAALDDLGLVGALQKQAAGLTTTSGPRFVISTDPNPLPTLPAAVEVAVFRIVGEAMTNVVRHADASECSVHIKISGEGSLGRQLHLEVLDDGCGMSESGSGLGLPSMTIRVEELGGQLDVDRRAPRGTVVTAMIPVPA